MDDPQWQCKLMFVFGGGVAIINKPLDLFFGGYSGIAHGSGSNIISLFHPPQIGEFFGERLPCISPAKMTISSNFWLRVDWAHRWALGSWPKQWVTYQGGQAR